MNRGMHRQWTGRALIGAACLCVVCGAVADAQSVPTESDRPDARAASSETQSGHDGTAGHLQDSKDPQSAAWESEKSPAKLTADHLPNAWRIHAKVVSGGLPEGDAAFKELADLGVKTIISVDGAAPDLAMAKKYGLRYVHMPHGYDGISEERAKGLAKAVRDLPGPIYIHCHHGKHRSPAAATVACVGAGMLSPVSAVAILKTAGTSENYRGLYQSAQSARRWDDALLDALNVDYPETVKIPPIADAMIGLEHSHDRLKALSAHQWRPLAEHPDSDAAHEALLLREQYSELLRTDEVARQPPAFRAMMVESESRARVLEDLLTQWTAQGAPSPVPDEVGKAMTAVTTSCTQCHQAYRDVPLSEK